MHLRSAAAQQVDEGGVEGHDGVTQVDTVLLMLLLATKPEGQNRYIECRDQARAFEQQSKFTLRHLATRDEDMKNNILSGM